MKKTWDEPRIEVQRFVANEYVATCWYFGSTNIVIQKEFKKTDGKSDTEEQKKMGFSDDGWDFLAGNEDTMEDANQKGWYCTKEWYDENYTSLGLHPNSSAPIFIEGGPWGNHVIGDMENDIYFFGGGPYQITSNNRIDGFGVNAS